MFTLCVQVKEQAEFIASGSEDHAVHVWHQVIHPQTGLVTGMVTGMVTWMLAMRLSKRQPFILIQYPPATRRT